MLTALQEDNNINFPIEILKTFFRHVDQGILFFDGNMRLLYANERAVSLLGAESQEKAGRVIRENCPEVVILKSKNGKTNSTFIEIKDPSDKGNKLFGVEFFFHDPNGFHPVYSVLLHDFSKWEKLDGMRIDFISSVSHRLRTPVTSLRNSLELLNMKSKTVSVKERKKLLEIGMRNIRRLSSSLDELQKIFMVESEEMNVIRSLVKIGEETTDIFKGLDNDGVINGFELKGCDIAVFIARSKLESYLTTVSGLFRNWIGVNPDILVELALHKSETSDEKTERFEISLKQKDVSTEGVTLKDFLYYQESHRSLLMERLAGALGGRMSINADEVTISIPVDPEFDREKDLVHPLHFVVEQSRIEKKRFWLVNLKIDSAIKDLEKRNGFLKKSLSDIRRMGKGCFVVMDEEPFSYLIFFVDRSRDEIEETIRSTIDQFAESSGISVLGENSFVSWEIKLQSSLEKDTDPNILNSKELV
ncbi:PAS domain-containing protein [bacterium]|nr:PAS domain-containing protein [bacterium]